MKAKKIIKRVVLSVVALLLVAVLVLCGITFFYYPHYTKSKRVEDLSINKGLSSLDDSYVRVMSCNVRCINPLDTGKRSWFYRADLLLNGIEKTYPGVIGFQEVTKWQYKYLTDALPEYDSVVTYRDKAINSESCPVFYDKTMYKLIDKGSFWLSETPDEMSKGWGAACYRICSYVILETTQSGKQFVVFNLHLDHVSEEARINGINLVLEKIKAFGGYPAVIMGDFNAEENTQTYAAVTEMFDDAKYKLQNPQISCTYQGFGEKLDADCIDYFMISKKGWNVLDYKVLTDTYNGVYPSDHFQLFTLLELV